MVANVFETETGKNAFPWVGFALPLLAFGVAPLIIWLHGGAYVAQVAGTAAIYALLAASLNHVTGTAGLLSLGHAAFFGIGAYAAALGSVRLGLPFIVTVPLAGLVAGLLGVILALPALRLVSIYFAVATLGLGEMIHLVLLNWVDLTRGPMGIRGIQGFELFGLPLDGPLATYLTIAAVVSVSVWVLHRLTHSYYGTALRALREDDQCAEAMGLNTVLLKAEAFGVSCFFAGIAGALLSHQVLYISPDSFRFSESILILAMVVVGGLGSLPGAVAGAVLLTLLPEVLRGIGDFRMIVVGVVMFVCILLLPKGLFGEISALGLVRRQFGNGIGGWRR